MENAESELVAAFLEAFSELPGAHVERAEREFRAGPKGVVDALIEVDLAGRKLLLIIEAKRSAYPRDVREAAWQLQRYRAHFEGSTDRTIATLLVADAISPGARELLREESVGYFDRGGSIFLPVPGAYVFVDKPPPKQTARQFSTIFHGRKAVVVRMVFAHRSQWLSVKELARQSGVSSAMVSETLTELERRDWVEAMGSGPSKMRRLVDPEALLDAWTQDAERDRPLSLHRYYVPAPDNVQLIRALGQCFADHRAAYAITGEAAAQAYSPFLTSVSQIRCRALAGTDRHDVLADLGARPVSEGWNLAVIDASSLAEFSDVQERDGVMLASPLQTYLDLLHSGGRAKDMATHLRGEMLR